MLLLVYYDNCYFAIQDLAPEVNWNLRRNASAV
jgi:hypothetical protein